jgi:hypothetical protein
VPEAETVDETAEDKPLTPSRLELGRQVYRRGIRIGIGVSVGLHLAVLLLWRTELSPLPMTVAAGPRTGSAVAAAGGGPMQAMNLAPPRTIEVPPPPTPMPEFMEPEVAVDMPEEPQLNAQNLDMAGNASFRGTDGGPGLEGYDGGGDGGSDPEGRFRVTAPEPRSIIPEWDPPGEVKGMQVMVRVLIDPYGNPIGEVELRPSTPNRKFNKRLREKVLMMDYKPARRQGRPITAWAEMTFVF